MARNGSCAGPFVWFDVDPVPTRGWGAECILECACCGLIHVGSGVVLRRDHYGTDIIREGIT